MKFKYNFLAGILLGGLAVSCDPLDEIYTELDAKQDPIVNSVDEYVITADDYKKISEMAGEDAGKDKTKKRLAEAVAKEQAFNSFVEPSIYLPKFLEHKYFSWGEGSFVGVTYQYHADEDETITALRATENAFLSDKDYDGVWAVDEISGVHYLSPKHSAKEAIPAILALKYADATEGTFASVDYNYCESDPVMEDGVEIFSQDFSGVKVSTKEKKEPIVIEGWEQIQIEGSRQWEGKKYNDNLYAQMSAFGSKDKAEAVALVTSPVTISNPEALLTFDLKLGYFNGDCFTVYISDKYTGNGTFDAAEWTDLSANFKLPEGIPGSYTDMVNCGNASLAKYNGKTVRFAFVYRGAGDGVTSTVQLDNIKVTSKKLILGNSEKRTELYRFNGQEWKENKDKNVFVVTPEEYDSMGAPGKHDNFSSSERPEDYLPVFLTKKYPYAKVNDVKYVVYKLYKDGKTTVNAKQYELGEKWTESTNMEMHVKKSYFRNDKVWFLDPTTRMSFTKDDYVFIVNTVKNDPALEGYFDTKYGNSEYWYGASYFKDNFDFRYNKRKENDPKSVVPATEKEALPYFVKMAGEGIQLVLADKYPTRPAQENGADVFYLVTVSVFDGANWKYVYTFKGLGDGKFELSGEPEVTLL